jgi:hypothetical protein
LAKSKKHDEIERFVEELVSMNGDIPRDYIARKRSVVDEEESSHQSQWTSWKEASDKDGEDVLLEMVEAGTVETRRHPGKLVNPLEEVTAK